MECSKRETLIKKSVHVLQFFVVMQKTAVQVCSKAPLRVRSTMSLVSNYGNLRSASSSLEEDGCKHTRKLQFKHICRWSALLCTEISTRTHFTKRNTAKYSTNHSIPYKNVRQYNPDASTSPTQRSTSCNLTENIPELDLRKRGRERWYFEERKAFSREKKQGIRGTA